MKHLFTFLICLVFHHLGFGYLLTGKVTDEEGPVGFASIYIENTTYGVVSNEKGMFYMQLENGTYNLVVEFVGYEKLVQPVEIRGADRSVELRITKKPEQLKETVVTSDREDPAYNIIRKAIANREKNDHALDVFGCDVYTKASLEVENLKPLDSLDSGEVKKQKVNFLESYSRVYFDDKGEIREVKKAYRDLYNKRSMNYSVQINFDYSTDWNNIEQKNQYLYGTNLRDIRFNFYNDLVYLHDLSDRPYVSPLSHTTFLSYKFRFVETFLEDNVLVHKIEVIPRNKAGNLFKGKIYIEDGSYAIKAVDLELNPLSLRFFQYFKIIESYVGLNDSTRVLERQEFFYHKNEGRKYSNIGNTLVRYSHYKPGETYPRELMKGANIYYANDALEKDSLFWEQNRPVKLKIIELQYIHERDSVIKFHMSPKYLDDQDSIYNDLGFWDYTLNGIRHRNREKGTRFYIAPLIGQLDPFAVGGYRHKLDYSFTKEWKKGYTFYTWQSINYGFLNKDLRGSVDVSYTFLPKRFASVRGGYENAYAFVNNYESIMATFSRSNYVQKVAYRGGGRFELVNGLYIETLVEHAEYRSIEGITLERWSGELFGSLNEPQAFDNYTDMVIDIDFRYVIGQKYVMKPYKKEIIGKPYPELGMHYKKGLPSFFNSTVNYDFIEFTFNHEVKVRNMGTSRYSIHTGGFINDAGVRLTNRKFFRGSDPVFFSDPLRSFQLLGPSISTTRTYFQGQYIHHFNGALLNKLPLMNRLRLQAVGGAGILLTQDGDFRHTELYGGISRIFRIRSQLFKISGFYVVADSNHSNLSGQFKIGIDFYNSFTGSWSY